MTDKNVCKVAKDGRHRSKSCVQIWKKISLSDSTHITLSKLISLNIVAIIFVNCTWQHIKLWTGWNYWSTNVRRPHSLIQHQFLDLHLIKRRWSLLFRFHLFLPALCHLLRYQNREYCMEVLKVIRIHRNAFRGSEKCLKPFSKLFHELLCEAERLLFSLKIKPILTCYSS